MMTYTLEAVRFVPERANSIENNVVSAGTQGANIHVIGCIGPHGLVYHEIQRGTFRKESAQSWMR